jgi:hypothetical protein
MSTVNATTRTETPPKIVLWEPTPPQRTEPKVTAAQIEKGCPARLQLIGEEITKRFNEAQEQAKLLDDQVIELNKLIAEAKELCDSGGFAAFWEKFFPNLRKSRVYELLAIANNKKSVEETRASTRERVAKHRANQAAASFSVTVTEKLEQETLGAATEGDGLETTTIVLEQTPQPAQRRSVAPGDEALIDFSLRVGDLIRRTRNKEAERFANTSVTAEDLAKLGKFLTYLAALKNSEAVKPTPVMVLPGNSSVSSDRSAEDMEANRSSLDADLGADLDANAAAPAEGRR